MNDPNGPVYFEGRYHLFFQHNPYGLDWGNMSWGHAVSDNLIEWTELPVAVPCDESEQIFSGCVVVDEHNTSGLGANGLLPLIAVYTSVAPCGTQAQALAYSLDSGTTWTKYPSNPVLSRESTGFRDPKVFWFSSAEGGYWVMVVAEAEAREIRFYGSGNLRDWTELSTLTASDDFEQLWECPDLFPLPWREGFKWVLLLSVNPDRSDRGSATRYLIGDFDGRRFVPDENAGWTRFDLGLDCYAVTSIANVPDGRRIVIGWMSNWIYAANVPADEWRGAMTLPRELGLVELDGAVHLGQRPVAELDGFFATASTAPNGVAERWPAAVIEVVLDDERDSITLDGGPGRSVTLSWKSSTNLFRLDRHEAGIAGNADFCSPREVLLVGQHGRADLRIVADRQSIEVFTRDTTAALSALALPDGDWSLRQAPEQAGYSEAVLRVWADERQRGGRVRTAVWAAPATEAGMTHRRRT